LAYTTARTVAATIATSAIVAAAAAAPAASAHASESGGAVALARPKITAATCSTGEQWRCAAGQTLRLEGESLGDARRVAFSGAATVRPRTRSSHRLTVAVPPGARSGIVRVQTADGLARTPQALEVQPPETNDPAVAGDVVPTVAEEVFPIAGRHDLGQTQTNRFGGGRGHQGQDLFAACGTTLVAARAATVTRVTSEARAGNYVVMQDLAGESLVYMHLRQRASVSVGDAVTPGQPVGVVGQTGRATGCQLHLELWTAPGWYEGGNPSDPLPWLRRVDATHETR
jgi:murein DD-endopeptidase MepM/ murein hydrolase activator NlpD